MTTAESPVAGESALYRAVWRWHFYAGILAAPFAIFLAVTGGLYLWKPQFEARQYARLFNVEPERVWMSAEAQLEAASAHKRGGRVVQFIPAFAAGRTSEVVIAGPAAGEKRSVHVDPHRAVVVGEIDDAGRPMRILHDLHGSLLAGDAGSFMIELAASWMFVLLLTGLYLWWPRPSFTVWGFFLPRLRAEGRIFWRDVHAVPAVWFSLGALFLLATGLPWTNVGGKWFRTVSAALGEGSPRESAAGAHRSEVTGWSPPLKAGIATEVDRLASNPSGHEEHVGHGVMAGEAEYPSQARRISLDRAMEIAAERRVPQPYALALPVGERGVFSVISDRNQAFRRTHLHLDQYSGRVLADVRYEDYGFMGKFFLWGIIAHEGQLFGLLNQVLGSLAAAGVCLMGVSGVALWWQRRPAGKLFTAPVRGSLPRQVVVGTALLAAMLPLLAGSLVVFWCVDSVVRRRRASAVETA